MRKKEKPSSQIIPNFILIDMNDTTVRYANRKKTTRLEKKEHKYKNEFRTESHVEIQFPPCSCEKSEGFRVRIVISNKDRRAT